jgi:hypothetical protein
MVSGLDRKNKNGILPEETPSGVIRAAFGPVTGMKNQMPIHGEKFSSWQSPS